MDVLPFDAPAAARFAAVCDRLADAIVAGPPTAPADRQVGQNVWTLAGLAGHCLWSLELLERCTTDVAAGRDAICDAIACDDHTAMVAFTADRGGLAAVADAIRLVGRRVAVTLVSLPAAVTSQPVPVRIAKGGSS